MKIGVIGSGKMGIALGSAMVRGGAEVRFGSRDQKRVADRLRAGAITAQTATHREAVRFGDIIILSTRWEETKAILRAAGPFEGKILLSCTNSTTEQSPMEIGHTSSAAEMIAAWAPDAAVVEAFVDIYSEFVNEAPDFSTPPPTVLYCSDDEAAKASVASLIRGLGFDALDAGPLYNARSMEPLAQLVVYFVRKRGLGPLGLSVQWRR